VRATTVLRMLCRLKDQHTVVRDFEIDLASGTIMLEVAPTTRVGRCGACERLVHAVYDTRPRTWRHTDLGELRVELRYALRRLSCPNCGTPKSEQVPWAEHAAWHTYDFEDLVAYHAQQTSTTRAAELMRTSWSTVGEIVGRVVERKQPGDRLDGLRRIGIDELSYRKHHKYVTVVVDHDRQRVVWCTPGKSADSVRAFFQALGPERTKLLEVVSMDMSGSFIAAVTECAPGAKIVFDRFHVQRLAHDALDDVRRTLARELRGTEDEGTLKHTRHALQKRPWNMTGDEIFRLADVARANRPLYRAYILKEKLALLLDNVQPDRARRALLAWCRAAVRSKLGDFPRVGRTIRKRIDGIVAYVATGLNNGRTEGLNGKIRVLTRRAFGYHSAASLIAMITLCCTGLQLHPRHA